MKKLRDPDLEPNVIKKKLKVEKTCNKPKIELVVKCVLQLGHNLFR